MQDFNAGQYINQGYYKSFQPEQINKQWLLTDMELLELLSKADRQLGRLDMYSEHIPDIDLVLTVHEFSPDSATVESAEHRRRNNHFAGNISQNITR